MYHSFLIHSFADGHLGCFHVLAIINSAAADGHLGCFHVLTIINSAAMNTAMNTFNSGFLGVYAQQWDCWVIR